MRFSSILKKNNLDAFLVTKLSNVFYLSDFTGSNGQILITKNKKYFLTDSRYSEQSENEIKKDFDIVIYKKLKEELKKIIDKEEISRLGFESQHLTYNEYSELKELLSVEMIPVKDTFENIRIKKKQNELNKIKKAIKIAEKSLENVRDKLFDEKITEKEFAFILEYEMIKNGADEKSFPVIVASGARSSIVHGVASNKKIDKSLLLIDFGAKYKGYCSDKTVTFLLDKNNSEIKKIFNIVKDAKNFAIDKIKPGKKTKDIDKIARDYIDKKGYGKFFIHSLGHGVGVDVHEKPTISPLSEEIIEEKTVFTIEPGIYIQGKFGIRLEDMVYVNKTGAEVLTTLSEDF